MSSIALAILLSLVFHPVAQSNPASLGEVGHLAEVTGDDVYIRSGPGANYYPVAKVNTGVQLSVFDSSDGWSAVEPPGGCFSLIHKNFVDVGVDGARGVVNGENVLVRAGSDMSPQLYTKQCKLSRGAVVKVLRPHNGDYLRIAPPAGVRVYVSSQFVQRVPGALDADQSSVSSVAGEGKLSIDDDTERPAPEGDLEIDSAGTPSQVDTGASPVSSAGHIATSAEAMIQEEERKPLLERDYERVISRLRSENGQHDSASADSYAKARMVQLIEAARTVSLVRDVRDLGEEMSAERKAAQIVREKMRPASRAIGGGFDAVGELRLSMLYSSEAFPNRYRLVSSDGNRTLGYVEIPPDSAIDADRFVGRKVGVRARDTQLQAEDVDPLMIYTVSELVLLDGRIND